MSLVELRIRDIAIFGEAVVPVGPAFTALTGETGAGKSLCVTALRLALGGRADGDLVRAGAELGQASAVFDSLPPALRLRLDGLGVPADELTTLTREVSRTGRGSSRVNGALVSLAILRETGEALAEVTLQGSSHRLLHRSRQRDLLDAAAGVSELRERVREAVTSWRSATAAVEEVRRRQAAGAAELDAARRVVDDLSRLELVAGEDDALAGERLRLRNAAALAAAATGLRRAATGDDDDPGAADLLARAIEAAAGLGGVDPVLDALAADAGAILHSLRELGASARAHAAAIALDEGRLAEVEERLDVLARVRRRHGSVEEAVEALGAATELLTAGEDGGARLGAAEAAQAAARQEAAGLALELSGQRRHAARRLERDVEAALADLELPYARLQVVIEQRADPDGVEMDGATVHCGPSGIDEVELRLGTNRGATPAPLDQGPSGGELSRLVLALAACVTESGSPLLVLDEVDTGIGGETAARVGDLLAAIGVRRQVVVVTHRPEIASRADHHLLVRKLDTAGGARGAVEPLGGDARLAEIARLMSGRVTDAALARAVELRGEAVATIAARPRRPARSSARVRR